ncbi:hypothetical protein TRAPUB_1012 [Trametes pubescens]|uniref:Uncharacterized protein n=1 Tax=Trametes pubescens TaxID=154538 RepID=A0A1M2VKI3_TRAPU|nr:hypothetical protein TRAPUB_1012 [Trametes pubescens]
MPEPIGSNHPHFALLEYARDMHQYTLELWLDLSKKLDDGLPVPPSLPRRHSTQAESPSDRPSSDFDTESPKE